MLINRRNFLTAGATVGLASVVSEGPFMSWAEESSSAKGDAKADPQSDPKTDPWTSGAMGLASTSLAIRLGGYNHPAGPLRNDSIAFLEYCHSIGGAGVQTSVKGDLAKFRKRAEEIGMFVE